MKSVFRVSKNAMLGAAIGFAATVVICLGLFVFISAMQWAFDAFGIVGVAVVFVTSMGAFIGVTTRIGE